MTSKLKRVTQTARKAKGVSLLVGQVAGGEGITVTKVNGVFTISVDPGAIGAVVGPSSATDNAIARFDATSGSLLQDSPVTITDAGVITGAHLATGTTADGTFNIRPPSGSTTRGLDILQTFPSSGSAVGAIYGSLIEGTIDCTVTGSGPPGQPLAPNWSLVQISGHVGSNYQATGGDQVGQAYGLSVGLTMTGALTTDSDLVGASFGVFTNFSNPNARMYAGTSAATIGATGQTPFLIGHEFASSIVSNIDGTGTAVDRCAINLISYEQGTASRLNTAISVQGGNPGGEFSNVIALNPYQDGTTVTSVLKTDGDIIYIPTAQTINSIVNAPTAVLSYVYNTKHATLTGGGVGSFGSTTSPGGVDIDGLIGSNLALSFRHAGSITYQVGAVSGNLYIAGLGGGTTAIAVSSTNVLSFNGFTYAQAGNISLPAVAQGDLWYGSASGTISALAKDTGTSRFLKNSGTSNNPAWAQPSAADLSNGTTGTGGTAVVLATSPALVTPTLGVASATSINKVVLTAPATSATITIADGTTLTQTTSTSVGRGQYQGTNTNDSATAGNIGELIESSVASGSAVSLTTSGNSYAVTSISLTAGDWDVWGNIAFVAAGSTLVNVVDGWISTTAPATTVIPTYPNGGASIGSAPGSTGFCRPVSAGRTRISVNTTTTVYLGVNVNFSTSTISAYGYIGARRVR